MQYLSVKETAKRFNISERRVQQLCESGRIEHAKMISNVWVIPNTSTKPIDERVIINDENLISLSELCKELSISVATGRNWVKLGKLTPFSVTKKTPFFSREYLAEIKANIKTGKNTALKSRRNKKFISGNNIYRSYVSNESKNLSVVETVIAYIEQTKVEITDELLCMVVAECALQLILGKLHEKKVSNCLSKYLHGELPQNQFLFLINDFISLIPHIKELAEQYSELLGYEYTYEESEDILGLLYISLKSITSRKATGSYYTPTAIVQKLCHKLFLMNDATGKNILDPCCGTGNFILQLPSQITFDHVYGNDIDFMSVKIARINYALKYNISDESIIYTHITEGDYLSFHTEKKYDFIIGNPPWGYEFSDLQKTQLQSKFSSATRNSIESYDLFFEQALTNLNPGGVLSFILPEAILNVKTHAPIRHIILNSCSFQYLEFLGNAFDKVQCPCIILQTIFTGIPFSSIGMIVRNSSREHIIHQERKVSAECLSFSMTDEEYLILEKISNLHNQVSLAGNAKFALGVVTGNNKKYICQNKTEKNEPILKGSDLCKFKYRPANNYIVFRPESFQQVAPTEYYRAPEKLLYRFICNQLVFAYDNKQTLSLNSCNILIPEIEGLDMKYILAILNSRIVQFYFQKCFNSVKVLRSHIEQIPIPFIEKEAQEKIINMINSILETSDKCAIEELYDKIDVEATKLYGLNYNEYQIIKASIDGDNLFLF